MSGRPEILFPLFSGLEKLPGIGPKTAQSLEQMHIETPRDLLFSLPYSVQDRRRRDTVSGLELPTVATVEVTIGAHRPPRNRGGAYRITVTDAETDFQLVFFHGRSRYLEAQCPEGSRRLVSGKLELFDGIAQMVHPDHMVPVEEAATIPEFEPVYHLTHGVSQKTMFKALRGALDLVPDLPEWIDPEQVKREAWPSWDEAITTAHEPQGQEDLSPDAPARARLAYDELFAHQLTLAIARQSERKSRGIQSQATGRL
ncbi:MAG: ATP-dependent DNA helicase RecG, partial [Pseudomonadota bacterium]|nr:ATP-dependent DNA helicase RecG [Pseudomonadota bacterium]